MCTGRSPFRAETTYGVLHRIANDKPTPVCEVNTDVPVWLGQVIERLMAKRPEDRFESAAQVAELLEGCLAHVQQPAAMPLPAIVEQLSQLLRVIVDCVASSKETFETTVLQSSTDRQVHRCCSRCLRAALRRDIDRAGAR